MTTDSRRQEAILETLRKIVGRLLQTAPETLDAHASFLEMGADSIVLAEAIRVIEDTFRLRISIRQLFEELTTLDALAVHIEQKATPRPTCSSSTIRCSGTSPAPTCATCRCSMPMANPWPSPPGRWSASGVRAHG